MAALPESSPVGAVSDELFLERRRWCGKLEEDDARDETEEEFMLNLISCNEGAGVESLMEELFPRAILG